MSDTCSSKHPEELFTPGWHDVAQTPVVDGKYYDRGTGETVLDWEYLVLTARRA